MDTPSGSFIDIASTELGSGLRDILDADDLRPGDEPSYQIAKEIFVSHPLGAKVAETPVKLALSQEREVSVAAAPECVTKAFNDGWKELEATRNIRNVKVHSRIYGLASLAMGAEGIDPSEPVDLRGLWKQKLYFNVLDPLNTSGLIVDQDPNSKTFQKHGDLSVQGQRWHRTRTRTVMNEEPIYIAWTSSAFSYAGRSVYQRALYPLKSFLQTMITDDMVSRKAGVLIAKMESPGSIIDRTMKAMFGVKRALLKQAKTDNVLSIGLTEEIESLNLQNVNNAMAVSRDNIIKNIATAAAMPAKMLSQEAFVLGFGEGSEDAKAIAQYIDDMRVEMQPLFDWFDIICMNRSWNEDFYETVRTQYPNEYRSVDYQTAFYRWKNSFTAVWPSLMKEEPSEAVGVDEVKMRAAIAVVQVLAPLLDPENKAMLVKFLADCIEDQENLFAGARLELEFESMAKWMADQANRANEQGDLAQQEGVASAPKPFGGGRWDATNVADLLTMINAPRRNRSRAAAAH